MAKRPKKKKQSLQPALKPTAPVAEKVPAPPFQWIKLLPVLPIVLLGLWIYWPVLHGTWLWDDDYLIEQNGLVHDADGLWTIWASPSSLIDFFPLTVSVEWLIWQFWPNDPFPYHLASVLINIVSALLFWRLLGKLGVKLAWLGGLLFIVHPVMVESVAWMAELKNTLSMPPFLLAMGAWVEYERRGKSEYYFLSLGLFLVAMLCKTTMVAFPVIILLYAWWKRDRIGWRDIKHSLPFFAISLALALAVIAYLRHGVGEETIPLGGILSRLACAGLSISFYFSKCFLPVQLSPLYPQWVINPPNLTQLAVWPIVGGVIYWLWSRRQPWARAMLLGGGFFLLNLLPFVGFRAISFMRFAWVMDHFLYLPILGLIGIAVAALGQLNARLNGTQRWYEIGAVAIVIAVLAAGSHRYAKAFQSQETLWTYTIHRYPDGWPAHNNLGNALLDQKRLTEAAEQYREALRLNPGYPEAHNNLGIIYARMGMAKDSKYEFEQALYYCPDLESAKANLHEVEIYLQAHPSK
jgi:tetratricopeptide (TPR) repeat protein